MAQSDSDRRMDYPRLADAARELGLSVSTVSRAISGNGRVSESTRQRVGEYISSSGYRPNMIAKGLAHRKSYNICALLPADAFVSQAPFFQECLMGICRAASLSDYDVIVAADSKGEVGQLSRILRAEKADGYILMRAIEDDPVLRMLTRCGAPYVLIGSCGDPKIPQVDADNAGACYQLTQGVLKKGLSRPALLMGDMRHLVNRSREAGFMRAAREAGLGQDDILAFYDLGGAGDVARALVSAIEQGADCVFSGDDYICSCALAHLDGFPIPMASFYRSGLLGSAPVMSAPLDAHELGAQAARLLLGLLEKGDVTEG